VFVDGAEAFSFSLLDKRQVSLYRESAHSRTSVYTRQQRKTWIYGYVPSKFRSRGLVLE